MDSFFSHLNFLWFVLGSGQGGWVIKFYFSPWLVLFLTLRGFYFHLVMCRGRGRHEAVFLGSGGAPFYSGWLRPGPCTWESLAPTLTALYTMYYSKEPSTYSFCLGSGAAWLVVVLCVSCNALVVASVCLHVLGTTWGNKAFSGFRGRTPREPLVRVRPQDPVIHIRL